MKTRKLILIGIIVPSIIFGTYQSIMYQCETLPVFVETPRNPNLWKCLGIWEHQSEQSQPQQIPIPEDVVVHVETDKQEYHTNDVVMISGYVDDRIPDTNLTITIYNPLLDVVSILQVTISDDGTFKETLPIGGSLWEQNGIYSVSVQYGKVTDHTDFLYLSDLESDDLLGK